MAQIHPYKGLAQNLITGGQTHKIPQHEIIYAACTVVGVVKKCERLRHNEESMAQNQC